MHFIGRLQTNKVKYIIDSVKLIHSLDSMKLAEEIDRQAAKKGICMEVLAEVNIGGEESKSGVPASEVRQLISEVSQLKNIKVKGLMAIPPVGKSEESFEKMQELFCGLKADNAGMEILSMGMTSDFALAVKYGSNIVRIGSGIFGSRK